MMTTERRRCFTVEEAADSVFADSSGEEDDLDEVYAPYILDKVREE